MNEISTDYKATEKHSSWMRRQLEQALKYVPQKGGTCPFCGRFCRTNGTKKIDGVAVRSHRCKICAKTFQTSKPVGESPTLDDNPVSEKLKIDSRKKRKGK